MSAADAAGALMALADVGLSPERASVRLYRDAAVAALQEILPTLSGVDLAQARAQIARLRPVTAAEVATMAAWWANLATVVRPELPTAPEAPGLLTREDLAEVRSDLAANADIGIMRRLLAHVAAVEAQRDAARAYVAEVLAEADRDRRDLRAELATLRGAVEKATKKIGAATLESLPGVTMRAVHDLNVAALTAPASQDPARCPECGAVPGPEGWTSHDASVHFKPASPAAVPEDAPLRRPTPPILVSDGPDPARSDDPRADALDAIGRYLDPVALDLVSEKALDMLTGPTRARLIELTFRAAFVLGEVRAELAERTTLPPEPAGGR